MDLSRPLFLIGSPASGKTTLGRALGSATGIRFVDLDEFIEADNGMSISEIFATRGENAFRRMETHALKAFASGREPVIVACGGGTPCHADNMALMNRSGITVWLQASPNRLHERILLQRGLRPLADKFSPTELHDYISHMLAEREPFYSQAQYRFCTEHLENAAEIARAVDDFINLF